MYGSFFPFWILKEPLKVIIEGINHQGRFKLDVRKNYSLEEWLNTGTGSPGKQGSHHPQKCSRNEQTQHSQCDLLAVMIIHPRLDLMILEVPSNLKDSIIQIINYYNSNY